MGIVYVVAGLVWLLWTFFAWRRRSIDGGARVRDLFAIGAYVPITVVFFWRTIFLDGVSMPAGGGDLASFMYPVYSFAANNLQNGVIPLWNPYLYSGSPFAADLQSGLFYPLNLLAFLVARPFTYIALEELAIINFFLAAIFAYLYVRSLGVGALSSFAAGLVFGFGGFMTAHLGHLNMISAAVWLPLILLFLHRALAQNSLIAAVLAGAVYGVSIMAGHTQIDLYIAFILVLYWLWFLLRGGRQSARASADIQSPRYPSVKRQFAVLALIGCTGLASAAVHLLPSYELMRLSLRADLTYSKAVEYSASPTGLITLIIPHFFGDNPTLFWGLKWNLTEVYGYVGILPLLLAGLAVLLRKNRLSVVSFFGILAVLSLMLSLGENTALYGWLYKFVPGFDKVRSAGRFLLIFDLSIAVLAAFAVEGLRQGISRRDRPAYQIFTRAALGVLAGSLFLAVPFYYHALITSQNQDAIIVQRIQGIVDSLNLSAIFLAAGVGLLFACRYIRRGRTTLQYAILTLIVVDLFSANAGYNPTTEDILAGYQQPEAIQFLKENSSLARIDSVTNVWDVWQPDVTLLDGIDDVQGIFNPLVLADYNTYWEGIGSRSTAAYDLLNVKYVVARKDVQLDWSKFRPALTDAPNVNLYENTKAMPRAWLVPAAVALPRAQIIERLRSSDFDPNSVAYLEDGSGALPAGTAGAFNGRVSNLRYPSPNEVAMTTESDGAGLLVLSDVFYPGWRAFVDGREMPVLRADYLFKAIAVPAGPHEVRFVFQPLIWGIGLIVSALAWLCILAVIVVAIVRAPGSQPESAVGSAKRETA